MKSDIEKNKVATMAEIGNIDTALLTTYAIGQLSLGWIVQNCGGRKLVLVGAFLLSGVSTFAFGFLDSPTIMALMWGLAGAFAAPASPLFAIVVGESVPDSVRGTVMCIWASCENLGGVYANNVPPLIAAAVGPAVASPDAWRCGSRSRMPCLPVLESSHRLCGCVAAALQAQPRSRMAVGPGRHDLLLLERVTVTPRPCCSWVFYISGPLVAMWAPILLFTLPSDAASKPVAAPSKTAAAPATESDAKSSPLSRSPECSPARCATH